MVWKNSKNKKIKNFKTKPIKDKISSNGFNKTLESNFNGKLYSKEYGLTKDDLAEKRLKPTFLEKIQYSLRKEITYKKKIKTVFDNSILRTHPKVNSISNILKKKNLAISFINLTLPNTQKLYLQSKKDRRKLTLTTRFDYMKVMLKPNKVFQNFEKYNKFIRHFNYRGLLFRSFWFGKFISTLVMNGKKQLVWGKTLKVFSELKFEFGRNPVMMLFEILELYRMPLKALQPKNKTRKTIIRTHMISWWKQYTQLLRWIRHTLKSSDKTKTTWNIKIKNEIISLILDDSNSLVKKRLELNSQMIAYSKIALHFRWYKRYSKRSVNAIKIVDKRYYI